LALLAAESSEQFHGAAAFSYFTALAAKSR
jgi:hypothetical protein